MRIPLENICQEFWEKFWARPELWPEFWAYSPDAGG